MLASLIQPFHMIQNPLSYAKPKQILFSFTFWASKYLTYCTTTRPLEEYISRRIYQFCHLLLQLKQLQSYNSFAMLNDSIILAKWSPFLNNSYTVHIYLAELDVLQMSF